VAGCYPIRSEQFGYDQAIEGLGNAAHCLFRAAESKAPAL